jgi:DNA-binding CsgD family transcriptional regulator
MGSGLGNISDLSFEDIIKKRELPSLLVVEPAGRIVFATDEARRFLAETGPGDNRNGKNGTSRSAGLVPNQIVEFCREVAKQQSAMGRTRIGKSPCLPANQGESGSNQTPRRAMLFQSPSGAYMVVALSLARPGLSARRKFVFLVIQKIGKRKGLDPERLGQLYGLTKREQEVVARLVHGDCNKEIAASLHIEEYTVKDHLKHIMAKCQADSRVSIISKLLSV